MFMLPDTFLNFGTNCSFWVREHIKIRWIRLEIDRIIRDGRGRGLRQLLAELPAKTECVTILGCGASVLEVSDKMWEEIQESDTIGINFWIVHKFVPDVYFFEANRDKDRNRFMIECMRRRKEEYAKVASVVNWGLWRRASRDPQVLEDIFGRNICYFAVPRCAIDTNVRLERSIRRWLRSSFEYQLKSVSQYRGSLAIVLQFAVLAGYRKIRLVGVDLDARGYFWEYSAGSLLVMDCSKLGITKGKIHPTALRNDNIPKISMSEFLKIFAKSAGELKGVSVVRVEGESEEDVVSWLERVHGV